MRYSETFRVLDRSRRALAASAVLLVALAVPAIVLAAAEGGGPKPISAPSCLGLEITVFGTAGDDRLRGTPDADVIGGFAGDDRIIGGGGLDVVCGGPDTPSTISFSPRMLT